MKENASAISFLRNSTSTPSIQKWGRQLEGISRRSSLFLSSVSTSCFYAVWTMVYVAEFQLYWWENCCCCSPTFTQLIVTSRLRVWELKNFNFLSRSLCTATFSLSLPEQPSLSGLFQCQMERNWDDFSFLIIIDVLVLSSSLSQYACEGNSVFTGLQCFENIHSKNLMNH